MKNKLPEYYAVKIDTKHPLMDRVWKHFDELCHKANEIKWEHDDHGRYIAYDGNNIFDSGTNKKLVFTDFKNNPTLLSIDEFVSLLENTSDDHYEIF